LIVPAALPPICALPKEPPKVIPIFSSPIDTDGVTSPSSAYAPASPPSSTPYFPLPPVYRPASPLTSALKALPSASTAILLSSVPNLAPTSASTP